MFLISHFNISALSPFTPFVDLGDRDLFAIISSDHAHLFCCGCWTRNEGQALSDMCYVSISSLQPFMMVEGSLSGYAAGNKRKGMEVWVMAQANLIRWQQVGSEGIYKTSTFHLCKNLVNFENSTLFPMLGKEKKNCYPLW